MACTPRSSWEHRDRRSGHGMGGRALGAPAAFVACGSVAVLAGAVAAWRGHGTTAADHHRPTRATVEVAATTGARSERRYGRNCCDRRDLPSSTVIHQGTSSGVVGLGRPQDRLEPSVDVAGLQLAAGASGTYITSTSSARGVAVRNPWLSFSMK